MLTLSSPSESVLFPGPNVSRNNTGQNKISEGFFSSISSNVCRLNKLIMTLNSVFIYRLCNKLFIET